MQNKSQLQLGKQLIIEYFECKPIKKLARNHPDLTENYIQNSLNFLQTYLHDVAELPNSTMPMLKRQQSTVLALLKEIKVPSTPFCLIHMNIYFIVMVLIMSIKQKKLPKIGITIYLQSGATLQIR